jgi:hypothetical protein
VVHASEVDLALEQELFGLYEQYYDDVSLPTFRRDLRRKEWVILLKERLSGGIKGFSTLCTVNVRVDGEDVAGAFSGDTIVDRDAWGEHELVKTWYRLMERVRFDNRPRRVYWFLISKGYRTYLYLPTFFHRFFPRSGVDTPVYEQGLIDAFGGLMYAKDFNAKTGVIEFERSEGRLKEEHAGVPVHRLKDPNVAFFTQRNPGYRDGNELVCVAEFAPSNLREFGLRLVGAHEPAEALGSERDA